MGGLLYSDALSPLPRADAITGGIWPWGVDQSPYLIKKGLAYCHHRWRVPIIQLIHGHVATSRSIGRSLLQADLIAYLPSAETSMTRALALYLSEQAIHDF